MDDHWLRWKARLGSNKPIAFFTACIVFIVIGMLGVDLRNSLGHFTGPQAVTIAQLVNGQIGTDRYVRVSGTALYEINIKPNVSGRVTAFYYGLIDDATQEMLWIRSAQPLYDVQHAKAQHVTLIGMTRPTLPDVRKSMQTNLPLLKTADLSSVCTLYLSEGQAPMEPWIAGIVIVGLGSILLLSVAAMFMPSTVFVPEPIEAAAIFAFGEPGARVTAHLHRIRRIEPQIEFADRAKSFRKAFACSIPLDSHRLMIAVRDVVTHRTFAPDDCQPVYWGVVVEPASLFKIETGKLYGWHDRWAVRLEYKDWEDKRQPLIISFNHSGAQCAFVDQLSQMGYAISAAWPEMA